MPRRRPSLALACGLLALAMLAAWPLIAWWAHAQRGTPGIVAASVAVGICWLSSTVALVLVGLSQSPSAGATATLGSILVKTIVPLGAATFLDSQVPYLAEAGVFGWMVPAFLVALTTHTLLALWLVGPTGSVAKAS